MKINLARCAGFCFGVRRAIKIAFETAKKYPPAYILGDIVHNSEVVNSMNKAGIRKIKSINNGRDKTMLVRAHGISKNILERCRRAGFRIVDATCPMVKEIHRIAIKCEQEGYPLIIVGDKKHDEVRGIAGQLKNKPLIIESEIKKLPLNIKKTKKAAVVVQSTQNLDKVLRLEKYLKKIIPDLKFFNTICRPTRIRQKETNELPKQNDRVIIIGSKTSANTRRLYEIARSINKNSFWIQSPDQLKKEWFKGAKNVGITAGASTPDSTTSRVIRKIKTLARAQE